MEAEGYAREFARNIQSLRKKSGLQKGQMIKLEVFCSPKMQSILSKNIHFLLERTNSNKIIFSDDKSGNKENIFKIKDDEISTKFL